MMLFRLPRPAILPRLRNRLRRLRAFADRVSHAHDLWARLGFSWKRAWEIAGTWQ
jgi:hypothetical protein